MKNKSIKTISVFIILVMLIGSVLPSKSAGPLVTNDGYPLKFLLPMIYRLDKGNLGQLSNTEAAQLIEESFDAWGNVDTSTFSFVKDDPELLSSDVSINSNFLKYFKDQFIGYTPILFDNNGAISDLLCFGCKNYVLGFAFPLEGSDAAGFSEARAFINTRFYDGKSTSRNPEISEDTLKAVIIHEIGHALGLDHSQANGGDYSSGETVDEDYVPIMFPIAVNDATIPHRDDISSLSNLYPNSTELANYGTITGRVFDSDCTTPIQGVNVVARKTDDLRTEAVSCVSDYLETETGEFILPGLSPGNYYIEIEEINSNRKEGQA